MDLFSIPHLLIVLLVVMVLFGTNRLPEIGAGLGKAIRNFKQASSELDEVVRGRAPAEGQGQGRRHFRGHGGRLRSLGGGAYAGVSGHRAQTV